MRAGDEEMVSEQKENNNGFFGWLKQNAKNTPDKVAIRSIDQQKEITHGELFAIANRIGHYYKANNIGGNERVALLSNNSIEHLIVYLSSLAYGCTICTVHIDMNVGHFDQILEALSARLTLYEAGHAVIDETLQDRDGEWIELGEWASGKSTGIFQEFYKYKEVAGHWPKTNRTDDISIFYTSGTSSNPKGVVCSYSELYDNTVPIANAFGITSEDRILDFRSMNWMSAQVLSAIGTIAKGATLLLARKFSAGNFFDWINENGATIAAGNPTIINMLVIREANRGHNAGPNLRFITSSSAPLLVSEWQRFEETFGIIVCQGYGASEVGWISGSHEGSRKMGSVGRPVDYQQVCVVDSDGRALPNDEIGAIQLNGNPAGKYRYLNENGEIVIHAEGSTLTGDLGFIDKDGFLFVTGREKDLIIRGGINISPLEIDNVVLQIPGVAEVATVGVPDEIYGEQVIVYIQSIGGQNLKVSDVEVHCRQHLADFKMPNEIIFRSELPKTERGKMDRNFLAAEWQITHKMP